MTMWPRTTSYPGPACALTLRTHSLQAQASEGRCTCLRRGEIAVTFCMGATGQMVCRRPVHMVNDVNTRTISLAGPILQQLRAEICPRLIHPQFAHRLIYPPGAPDDHCAAMPVWTIEDAIREGSPVITTLMW